MTLDQERWAEALEIEKQRGAGCFRFVVERITALALADDVEGVGRFDQILERLAQLRLRLRLSLGSPLLNSEDLAAMSDRVLLRAYQNIDGEPGDLNADALCAEIERRGLDC